MLFYTMIDPLQDNLTCLHDIILTFIYFFLHETYCRATSASDQHKYEYQPLQDNAEIATLWIFKKFPAVQMFVMGWKVDMHWLLYSFVALAISVAWDAIPYSGFGIGARFIDTIAWTHLIRTVAFMITVLPNPRPGCYIHSFPPPPTSVWEFIKIGLSAKRGHGCNDLVISGHGAVYAAVPLAIQTFYAVPLHKGGATLISWLAVLKLCLQETVEKTHYSVDMYLAVIVSALVWHGRKSVYSETDVWKPKAKHVAADGVPKALVALVITVLTIVFVGVKGV